MPFGRTVDRKEVLNEDDVTYRGNFYGTGIQTEYSM